MSYSSEVLSDSPLAYWRMGDTSGGYVDSSGNGRDLSTPGTGTYTRGTTGLLVGDADAALLVSNFNSGACPRLASASWMDATNFTVSALVNPTSITGDQYIVGRNDTFANASWQLWLDDGRPTFSIYISGAFKEARSATVLTVGTAYLLQGRYTGSAVEMYVSSAENPIPELVATLAATGTVTYQSGIIVGSATDGSVDFKGTIDEVAYFGTSLSTTRLQSHASIAFGVSPLYWPNTGSIGTPWPASRSATPGQATLPSGSSGTSVAPSGSAPVARAPGSAIPSPFTTNSAQTVELWFTKPAGNVKGALFKVGANDAATGWAVGLGASDMDTVGGNLLLLREGLSWHNIGAVATGTHHLVVTRSGSNFQIYLDGSSVYGPSNPGTIFAPTLGLSFGGYITRTLPSTVKLDKIALYSSVLSGARVTAHYNSGAGSDSAVTTDTPIVLLELDGAWSPVDLSVAATIPQPTLAASLTGGNDSDLSIAATIPQPTMAVSLSGFNDSDLSAAGTVPQPVMAVSLDVAPTTTQLTVAGTIPQPTLAVSLSGFKDSDLTVSGTIPLPVLAVDLDVTPTSDTVAVAGAIPLPVLAVSLSATAVIGTDTTNFDDGVYLGDGYAEVVWEPDIVEPPFFVGPLTEDQVRVVAQVIDTAPGALPSFTPAAGRKVYAEAARDRVLINNEDLTYVNGAAAVVEGMKLIDPLLYGGCRITLPGINPQFESHANLVTRFRHARVRVQRVRDGAVIAVDQKAVVSRVDTSGTTLVLECGGQAAQPLADMDVQPAVFRTKQDVEHILCDLLRDARVQAKEHDGSSGFGLIKRGGGRGLEIFNETLAVWAGATGDPITWTPNANGVYRKTQKSDAIVATAYIDSSLVTQSLAQDFSEQPTRIYARGFTANGEIVTNIKTPGLTQGVAPELVGTLLPDDEGEQVSMLQEQLAIQNFLDLDDVTPGVFDAETVAAVLRFKYDAGLTSLTPEIGEPAWEALWNLASIGYSLDGAREYPTAQDIRTFKWFRTANGSKLSLNPDYDPHFIPTDLTIDVGGPFGKGQIRDFAQSKLTPDEGVWTGTLTFRSGLIWGDHSPGDPLVAADVMDRRDLLPNMRIKLPYFGGGISVYVAGVDHGPDETTCLVSSVPQTTMETWQAIERRREAKSNPGRAWSGHTRASQVRNDVAVQWDTSSGWIANKVALVEGWNEVKIPAGQSGIVKDIRAQLEDAAEFACLLTQRPVSIDALNNNPHTADPLTDPRPSTRPWFEIESVVDWLDGRGWLDAWGTEAQPCGYDPSRKTDELGPTAQAVTGKFYEAAGLNYETGPEPVLYYYVRAYGANNLLPGRILRNQRTTDL